MLQRSRVGIRKHGGNLFTVLDVKYALEIFESSSAVQ